MPLMKASKQRFPETKSREVKPLARSMRYVPWSDHLGQRRGEPLAWRELEEDAMVAVETRGQTQAEQCPAAAWPKASVALRRVPATLFPTMSPG